MISEQLVALQILLPLFSALFCVIISNKKIAYYICFFATLISYLIALDMFCCVKTQGKILYNMGGWEAPYGIELEVNSLSSVFLILVSVAGLLSVLNSRENVIAEIQSNKIHLFYAVFMLCFSGLLGIISSNDIFNIYVFLEISSLSTYSLVAMGNNKQALLAAFEYLIIGTVGATFYLIGVGFIYAKTGTLNITDLVNTLPAMLDSNMIKAAFVFIVTGIAIKSALFPFHKWLVNAYTYAPSLVSIFLSGTSTKIAIYLMIKMMYVTFGFYFVFEDVFVAKSLMFCSIAAILSGSLLAMLQTDIRRMLAYSSVAQIGYIIAIVSFKSKAALMAAIIQIISHSLAKTTLFMTAGELELREDKRNIEDLGGLSKSMPSVAMMTSICLISMIGIPITLGFVSKLYLINATIEANQWAVTVVILLSSLFTSIYSYRIMTNMYLKSSASSKIALGFSKKISMLVPVALIIFFGLNARSIIDAAEEATKYIIR